MTEVIGVALYAEVLGPWDSDCAGGSLGDSYQRTLDWPIYSHYRRTKHLSSVDYFLVWFYFYLYISIIHSYERRQDLVCQFLSFISKLNDSIQQSTV